MVNDTFLNQKVKLACESMQKLSALNKINIDDNSLSACEYGVIWAYAHPRPNPRAKHFFDLVDAMQDAQDNYYADSRRGLKLNASPWYNRARKLEDEVRAIRKRTHEILGDKYKSSVNIEEQDLFTK